MLGTLIPLSSFKFEGSLCSAWHPRAGEVPHPQTSMMRCIEDQVRGEFQVGSLIICVYISMSTHVLICYPLVYHCYCFIAMLLVIAVIIVTITMPASSILIAITTFITNVIVRIRAVNILLLSVTVFCYHCCS